VEVPSSSFLDSVLSKWQTQESALSKSGFRSRILRNVERQHLGIEVEGPRHIASIQAWEHAQCLDVVVMGLSSKDSRFLSGGPCVNFSEAEARLSDLCAILLEN
jgi:hypothetical protein